MDMLKKLPYQKSCTDEIDFKVVDQLHGAVSQISGFCFEIKKICVATLFIVLTLIVKITNNKLDLSIFISSYCMILSFWFLDSVAYYYQIKLRGKMQEKLDGIENRNDNKKLTKHDGITNIEKKTKELWPFAKILNAGINHSMWLYLILFLLSLLTHYLYSLKVIT